MATTIQLSDYLGALTQKDTLSTTDTISIIDVGGGNCLKGVNISSISGSINITGSVIATSFNGTVDISYIDFSNVPISSSGLSVGSLYKESGFLRIVE